MLAVNPTIRRTIEEEAANVLPTRVLLTITEVLYRRDGRVSRVRSRQGGANHLKTRAQVGAWKCNFTAFL